MILNDDLLKYVPSQWTLVYPNMYNLAIVSSVKKLAELAINETTKGEYAVYWRRLYDDPQLELGL